MTKPTTDQVAQTRDAKGRITGGIPPVGFHTNPENRNPGGWDKTQSISYQYNRIMRLSPEELSTFQPKTVAQKIALERIKVAMKNIGLNDAKEITDRTEGKAPQFFGVGDPEDFKIALVRFAGDDDATDQD